MAANLARQADIFDRVLKILARDHVEAFLRLTHPGARVQVIGTEENVELTIPGERVDFIHRILDDGVEKLYHLEFQL
ncbi:MAG TPA: hypothetical protein EYH31_12945, partial [Anaerolineae bacterium]|nr:hypothetical protein [Anaerolineae bacterium]